MMRCFECEQPAVALCRTCLVGQCEHHAALELAKRARSGALGGCSHRAPRVSKEA